MTRKISLGVARAMLLKRCSAAADVSEVPALVVTGGWIAAVDTMGELTAELTGGRHVIVQAPNHFFMSSNPAGFNSAITSFMRQVDVDRSSAR